MKIIEWLFSALIGVALVMAFLAACVGAVKLVTLYPAMMAMLPFGVMGVAFAVWFTVVIHDFLFSRQK